MELAIEAPPRCFFVCFFLPFCLFTQSKVTLLQGPAHICLLSPFAGKKRDTGQLESYYCVLYQIWVLVNDEDEYCPGCVVRPRWSPHIEQTKKDNQHLPHKAVILKMSRNYTKTVSNKSTGWVFVWHILQGQLQQSMHSFQNWLARPSMYVSCVRYFRWADATSVKIH